jgi:hypothetical protein
MTLTVSSFLSQDSLQGLFSLPLSIEACQQLQTLQIIKDEIIPTKRLDCHLG